MDQSKIITLSSGYHVWTRKEGQGPIKILLLHGGPGMTHEYLEPFSKFISGKPIQIIYYEQLGSFYSDQPDNSKLWTIDRFCKEVEEIRQAYRLDDFYLYGQSWGGILAMEYAYRYPQHLKALISSNMIDDMSDYDPYFNSLRDSKDPLSQKEINFMKEKEGEGKFSDPDYIKLVMKFYHRYMCRLHPWPGIVVRSVTRANGQVASTLTGGNLFQVGGLLKNWSIRDRLKDIHIPTLLLGARYDTMNPDVIRDMVGRFPNAQAFICPNGSHLSILDDQKNYFQAINKFLNKIQGK